jgi:Icc-related predicted phosphoesterase
VLAGDLTAHGRPEEAAHVAAACRGLARPVLAVLGNHDLERRRVGEVVGALRDGGIGVLHGDHRVVHARGVPVGVTGTTGVGAGFPGAELPPGEAARRRAPERAELEVGRLEDGLRAIRHCALRLVVLHYSPTVDTLVGEKRSIWGYLGSARLAEPIRGHGPHLVVHAHAHRGTFSGRVGDVPVYNVSSGVIRGDFSVFELQAGA